MVNIISKRLVAVVLFVASSATVFAQPYSPSKGSEQPRSSMVTYRSVADALVGKKSASQNYVDLDGEFRVKYFNNREEVTAEDLNKNADLSTLGDAVVLPKPWQKSGKGEAVNYKEEYPFLNGKPVAGDFTLPTSKVCALYQRDFTVPFDFTDRKLYMNIGAANSKVTLYINGTEVGFATDSRNPSEFEISEYVGRGRNRMSIAVEEFSGASWLEGQSGINFNGVNRGIYMFAQPKIRMRDILATTQLDPTYTNGLLSSALLLKSELLNPHTVTVYYTLYDPKGEIIRKENRDVLLDMRREDTVRFNSSIPNVKKWNSETPELYTIVYSVKREGRFTEYASAKVGFRSVEIKDQYVLVNGVAPVIRGVNYEELDPTTGNVLSAEKVEADLRGMRLSGINAIRTGGYPLPSFFYDMTDSLGFYVVNVSNISTSGLENDTRKGYSLSNDPKWCSLFVDRAVSTYERTKRNSSVVAVALGEDAGNGYNMYEAYLELKRRDPNGLVIYDGAAAQWNTDFYCPLYPEFDYLQEVGKANTEIPVIPSRVEADSKYWSISGIQGAFMDKWTNGSNISAVFNIEVLDKKEGLISVESHLQYANVNDYSFKYRTVTRGRASKWKTANVDCKAGETNEVVLGRFGNADKLEIEIGNIYKGVIAL